jgi:hypothetical protein
MNRSRRTALATIAAVVVVGMLATGVAQANATLSLDQTTGLADGQQVSVTMTGLNAVSLANVTLSECATSPGVTLDVSTDCKVLDVVDVSTSSSFTKPETVYANGIGLGNRSCVMLNWSCDVRVTEWKNQLTMPVPSPVPVSFDAVPPPPLGTTTSVVVPGGAAIVNGDAYVHVTVAPSDPQYVVQGDVSVDVDGTEAAGGPLGAGGTVSLKVGNFPGKGTHDVVAHFAGNQSFLASDSTTTQLNVVSRDNISIGDVSLVEGNSGFRKMQFPVVLSQPSLLTTTVHYTIKADSGDTATVGLATAPTTTDVVAGSGTLTFKAGSTLKFVATKILGDTRSEGDETVSVDLDTPTNNFDFRRATGKGTIIDDDASPPAPTVALGDLRVPEADVAFSHIVKVPLTLSQPLPKGASMVVSLTLSSVGTATRGSHGDWNGAVNRSMKIGAKIVNANVGITVYPDRKDEPDLQVKIHINSVVVSPGTATVPVPDYSVHRDTGMMTIVSDE